jgi:lipocalin-like protein
VSSVFLSSAVLHASCLEPRRRFTATIREHKIEKRIRCVILEMSDTVVSGPTNEKLVGTWKLVSASSKTKAGERSETPYGPDPAGFLTYTADGRVTALISYGGRKPLSVGAQQEEQAEAFKTFLAYAGRYALSGDKVIHYIEISSIQNYVNKELVRSITFRDDQIILVTPPTPVNGKVQTVELVWQRLLVG